jgi:SAM-dependent methyltransferase
VASGFVDPVDRTPLTERDGMLVGGDGRTYAVRDGIPRFVEATDDDQGQTSRSFAYKWGRRDTWESEAWRELALGWLLERYGFRDRESMREHLAQYGRILDAGCGGGFTAALWTEPSWPAESELVAVDISDAVEVARERLRHVERARFVQADVLALPFPDESFDAAIAEGVLHHTPSTEAGVASLARVLRPGGEALLYVYRRKAPLRELADDHVRAAVSGLSPEEAWETLRPLTRLGQALAELGVEVDVPEDVPVLGIAAGRYDVQRLVYWHFAKLYWNERLTLEENTHVNYDWYHPRYAHRHSEEEVRAMCAAAGLQVVHLDAQESGFTVRALKG